MCLPSKTSRWCPHAWSPSLQLYIYFCAHFVISVTKPYPLPDLAVWSALILKKLKRKSSSFSLFSLNHFHSWVYNLHDLCDLHSLLHWTNPFSSGQTSCRPGFFLISSTFTKKLVFIKWLLCATFSARLLTSVSSHIKLTVIPVV